MALFIEIRIALSPRVEPRTIKSIVAFLSSMATEGSNFDNLLHDVWKRDVKKRA